VSIKDLLGQAIKKMPSKHSLEIEEGDKPDMADTIGSLADKLTIVNLKMWYNQEILYEMRRMSEDEFRERYGDDIGEVHRIVAKCCDMNVLRNLLIEEIDAKMANVAKAAGISEEEIRSLRLVAPSHKTY